MQTALKLEDLIYRNCEEQPFRIYGVFKENGKFRRIPEAVASKANEWADRMHICATGGRIRFKTDSEYIAINATISYIHRVSGTSVAAAAGFDFYVKKDGVQVYDGFFIPKSDVSDGFEACAHFKTKELREITINFPYFACVDELYIGLQDTAILLPADDYKYEKPIVYYGSSITHGVSASRAGNTYPAILSRIFDTNFINLGFGGGARADASITDYIKKLDMSVFVFDYDHNAESADELRNTHEKMFKAIREENPNLPIIIMPRPKYTISLSEQERFEVIKRTYNNAIKSGDKNVYFIDGKTLMAIAGNDGIVDDCHPNDLGFYSMAKAIEPLLKKILK